MGNIVDPADIEASERAVRFAKAVRRSIRGQLGAGADGVVLDTTSKTAIKALKFEELYVKERNVYVRLQEHNVEKVCGFNVPRMLAYNDELWTIEMDIVSPPYILDFAGALVDIEHVFPEETMADWRAAKAEQFEEDWPLVRRILSEFRSMGIYLTDVHPRNINFGR